MAPFQVLDSGLRGGRANMAFGAALIARRRAGLIPDTLRFFRFTPAVLIGRHQRLAAEVNLSDTAGVELARRLTGGGAVYVDERQLCWEVVIESRRPLAETTAQVCTAVAAGLCRLGIDARFPPGNDIEAGGRKICGTAGVVDGPVQLLHGTLLLDGDLERMTALLTPPADKLARHRAASVAERVTTLRQLLGTAPSVMLAQQAIMAGLGCAAATPEPPGAAEEAEAAGLLAGPLGSDGFLDWGDVDAG
jgi:lipoate-protein ligase A